MPEELNVLVTYEGRVLEIGAILGNPGAWATEHFSFLTQATDFALFTNVTSFLSQKSL